MSSAESAQQSSSTPATAAAAATGAAATPASDFLQQRLAAVADLPPEQRSHDQAGFLRAHELLAEAQDRIAALGSCDVEEQDAHASVAALALLGGLEELCGIGVPLQLAVQLYRGLVLGLLKHAPALQQRAGEASAHAALRFISLVSTLLQFMLQTVVLQEDRRLDTTQLLPSDILNPAELLGEQHTQLFHAILSRGYQLTIKLMQLTTMCKLPGLAQLRCLWAELCWLWAGQLAAGMRPSWMASYPGPTRDEARQLQLRALAAMRSQRPSHPLTARMVAQTRLAINLPGPSAQDLVRAGLQQAAAAGGPHGSSMFTAEFAYGLTSSSAPTADTPPWGLLTLAESAQLLQQADAALARCKDLLPPAYLSSLKLLRNNPSVRWRRAAVERHQQAGAEEWREDLLAVEAAPPVTPGQLFARQHVRERGGKCTGCGTLCVELQTCSGCKLAKYCSKECHVKHWPEHKAQCRAARTPAAAVQQREQQQQQQGEEAGEAGSAS